MEKMCIENLVTRVNVCYNHLEAQFVLGLHVCNLTSDTLKACRAIHLRFLFIIISLTWNIVNQYFYSSLSYLNILNGKFQKPIHVDFVKTEN